MADEFDVARWLFGSSREETHTNDSTMTVSYGTAMSDSDGGRVYVSVSDDATTTVIGSNGVSEQVIVGDTSVEMPTNVQVFKGDNVMVGTVNRRPTVIGVVGRGDDIAAAIENIEITADIDEINARFEAADALMGEIQAQAQDATERAEELASQIEDVEYTYTDPTTGQQVTVTGIQNVTSAMSGSIETEKQERVNAVSSVSQSVNHITMGVGNEYTTMVNTLKNDSSLTVTASKVESVVSTSYINNKISGTYVAQSDIVQQANYIRAAVNGIVTRQDGALKDYTKTSELTLDTNGLGVSVSSMLNATLSDSGSANPNPYVRQSQLTLTEDNFNITFSVGFRGTCTTGAGVKDKVVTCAGFKAASLVRGATVNVIFTNANTNTGVDGFTLKVGSSAAKSVVVAGNVVSATNQLLWATQAQITFTYDGTYWRVAGEPRNWQGACGVASGTQVKTVTVNEVVICKGTTLNVRMSNSNTSANAQLNVSSTGEKDLFTGTGSTVPTNANGQGWTAGSTVPMFFDGVNWRIGDSASMSRAKAAQDAAAAAQAAANAAAATATDYLNFDTTNGLVVGKVTNGTLGPNIQLCNQTISEALMPGIALRSNTSALASFYIKKINNQNQLVIACGGDWAGVNIEGSGYTRMHAKTGTGECNVWNESSTGNGSESNGSYMKASRGVKVGNVVHDYSSTVSSLVNFASNATTCSGGINVVADSKVATINATATSSASAITMSADEISIGRTVLYNNANGTNGNVPLNNDIRTFKRVVIYYKDNAGTLGGSIQLPQLVLNQAFDISMFEAASNSTTWIKRARYSVGTHSTNGAGRVLNVSNAGYVGIDHVNNAVAGSSTGGTNNIYIIRVDGFNMY